MITYKLIFRRGHYLNYTSPERGREIEDIASGVGVEVHWVMVGDSHVRYIFDTLLRRFQPSKLQYRLSSFPKRDWRNIRELLKGNRLAIRNQTLHVRHTDLLIRLTYEWDPFLLDLPNIIKPWLEEKEVPPALLLLGGALHWIRTTAPIFNRHGVIEAVKLYKSHLTNLIPLLTRLAPHTNIVFKLLDHIAGLNFKHHLPENLEVYNQVAREVMAGSDIAVWDSTIPLSQAYVAEVSKLLVEYCKESCRVRCRFMLREFWHLSHH
ncbi:hypothetical protein Pmani_009004 [Petrolisthes manimaculis]|uniref:Uncharacterized protein n=1 Tax=Petrolisthes manimaculis TaxID=1843537 RepID=A0AAE1Q582_9EUCA|nr:hypothetical protein Pmani_009004 [Petrolisthes manimaculis]